MEIEKELSTTTTTTTTTKNNTEDKDKSSYSQKITIYNIKKMNIDEVYEWIKKDFGIREEQAIKFKNLNIDGSILDSLTDEKLIEVFALIQPSIEIVSYLNEIKNNGI